MSKRINNNIKKMTKKLIKDNLEGITEYDTGYHVKNGMLHSIDNQYTQGTIGLILEKYPEAISIVESREDYYEEIIEDINSNIEKVVKKAYPDDKVTIEDSFNEFVKNMFEGCNLTEGAPISGSELAKTMKKLSENKGDK